MLSTGDYNGREQLISSDTNSDGGQSPRYGWSDSVLSFMSNLFSTTFGLIAPASKHAPITPSDSVPFAGGVTKAIFVGVGGNLNLTVGGTDAVYKVQSGQLLPVKATAVKSTNTNATDLVRLYD